MKLLLRFVLIASAVVVFVGGAYGEQVCRVERRGDYGLAEYRPGALDLRTEYDTWSADECFQRCCTYKDDAGNHCNAVSYYDAGDGEYAVCLLLSCAPLDSCVWTPATNFTAALVLQDIAEEMHVVNQSAAWNQSTVTSQESAISVSTALPPGASVETPAPSGSPDLQDWNVINGGVPPSQVAAPDPDSAPVPDGTLSNNGSSNGTGTAEDAWNVLGLGPGLGHDLGPGNADSAPDNFTAIDYELTDNRTIPDSENDWNVVDTGVLSDNEQPTNTTDNGQQEQQQQQPVVNPFEEGPKDDWNDGLQDGDDNFWNYFGADDKFWSDEDDQSQSNKTVPGTEADQNGKDLEQPFNQPEQPFNQPEQPFNQPEQPFDQLEQPLNQPEQPQQSFDDVRLTEENLDDWQMGNEETPPGQEDDTAPVGRSILISSPGIIIGLCSALGVAFLVLVAVCRKVYQGQEWPKYKPLRSDYDMRCEASSSSSALLP